MSEQEQILEPYLRAKFSEKSNLSIVRLDKIADGWESDNYILTVEYGNPRTREDWVWRIYSGEGRQVKAAREFNGMKILLASGYSVPRVFLLETDHSPVDRPFVVMEYIPGEPMWGLLGKVSKDRRAKLIDRFCQLFVELHDLDWKQFDESLPKDDPLFFIDRWLGEVRGVLRNFPDVDASPLLDWVSARRDLFACEHPSPVHQDFHPGNILVGTDDSATVIDWTNFAVTDLRFDLSWTLVLVHAYGREGMSDQILQCYQRHAGRPVEQIEAFEAIACARRLFDLTISLTLGAQRMGMNAQAADAMRADMEPHKQVYQLFIERTGLQIKAFDNLFGKGK